MARATVCAAACVMSSLRDNEQSDLRFRALRALASEPELTQRQLADRLGVSLGRVNYCLHALVEKGFVKFTNFRAAEDKRRYLYLLTPEGMSEKLALTGRFLARKIQEHDALTAEIAALHQETRQAEATPDKSAPHSTTPPP